MESIIQSFVTFLGVYAAAGIVFALPFSFWGAPRIDPAAKGSPLGFRLLLLPAATALWPLLLIKWIKALQT
ncbi:MAG: hypothetical protein KDC43_14160 [Saprospiraceae bacterium]|nr:hypothetical protein [Saprospiraceae bacterium]MCB0625016.1 hypothetical protein [Saprospiraceae bacterium]MCB0676680.1 hypothetical protein [Saprospiraceae bacterium]